MTIKWILLISVAASVVSTEAVAQQPSPMQPIIDALAQIARERAAEAERRQAESRVEAGESTYEQEQARADRTAQQWESLDRMAAQNRATAAANQQLIAERRAQQLVAGQQQRMLQEQQNQQILEQARQQNQLFLRQREEAGRRLQSMSASQSAPQCRARFNDTTCANHDPECEARQRRELSLPICSGR